MDGSKVPLAPLEHLPTEIFEKICRSLQLHDFSTLALASRALYVAVQAPLYRHAIVPSYKALMLFVRSLNQVSAYTSQVKWWQEERTFSKTVVTLDITIDSVQEGVRSGGHRPTAALIARMVSAVSGHCPNVSITLRFLRSSCNLPPISSLETETFPRVTKLVLFVGKSNMNLTISTNHPSSSQPQVSLRGSHSYRRHGMSPFPYDCRPDVRFWRPYINGTSFPDCRSIELNHYWSAPPCDAVPLITIARHANDSCRNGNFGPKHIQAELSTPIGLRKLESLSLEYVLELHKDVLQQLFKSRMADNLRILELRFCLMGNDMIADLMEVALPSLTHFTFLDRISSDAAESSREALNHNDHSGGHLCPRVRKFGKNLHHLYLAVPYVCRDLFLSEAEADALHRAGIVTDIGTPEGNLADGMNLDRYAIKQVLSEHRRKQSTLRKNAFIAQAIAEAKVSNPALGAESMFGGGGSTIELKAARDAEYAFDQEAIKRARTISDTKGRWTRTIVAWDGLCRDDETWAELMVEADLEDVGVEWVLANRRMEVASKHRGGTVAEELDIGDVIGRESDNDKYDL